MGLSPGIGTAITIDLLCRPKVSNTQVARAVQKLTALLEEHAKTELERLSSFEGFKVFRWQHEEDQCIVLRVSLMFKAESSADVMMRKLSLGIRLSELLEELSGSIVFSEPLVEVLESKKLKLKENLNISAKGNVVVARGVLATLADELLYALEDAESSTRVENEERRGAFQTALRRTRSALLGASGGNGHKPVQEMSLTGFAAGQRADTDAELGVQSSRAARLRTLGWSVAAFLRATKAETLEWRFETLSDFLFGNAWVKARLPPWLTREGVEEPGAMAVLWKRTCAWLDGELNAHWRRVTNSEKAQRVWAEQEAAAEAERLKGLSAKEKAYLVFLAEKRALARKLAAMGISNTGDNAEEVNVEAETPVQAERRLAAARTASERTILEAYEASATALYAVHGINVQSGVHRVAVTFQGLDIFELLPEPLPVPKCEAPPLEK